MGNSVSMGRHFLAIFIILLFSTQRAFFFLRDAYLVRYDKEGIGIYEKRFKDLRKFLVNEGEAGYISEKSLKDFSDDEVRRYYLAQYALVPTVLNLKKENRLVVGNFYPQFFNSGKAYNQLELVKDFGDGVMLFESSPQPQ